MLLQNFKFYKRFGDVFINFLSLSSYLIGFLNDKRYEGSFSQIVKDSRVIKILHVL